MDHFFNQIIYSAANEDPASEIRALSIRPSDQVLTIAGSGARPLDLLTCAPAKVVSLDMNPKQSFLVELKKQAYRDLSYEELLAFFGVLPSAQRLRIYKKLRSGLTEPATQFWDAESQKISDGILYCGLWERYLRSVSFVFRARRKLITELFSCSDLSAQRDIWARWDNLIWKILLKCVSSKVVWKYLLKEPGYEYIEDKKGVSAYLHRRFSHAAHHHLFSDNPFLNLMVLGKYSLKSLPLHLSEDGFNKVKKNIENLEIVTGNLTEHLKQNKNRYGAMSLSDFSSYADPLTYKSIWESIVDSAADNARVCERFFLVLYQPDQLFPGQIIRSETLERSLSEQDSSFIYRFNCCRITRQT